MALTLLLFVAMTVLRFSGGELLAIRTGSMAPSMEPGDLLISRDVDPRTVRRGDVITVRVPSADNTLVTHRVTEVSESGDELTTKGDANDTEDPFTTAPDDVLGIRWFSVPAVGRAMVFLSSGLGTALLIAVPGAIYLGQVLADRRRANRAADAAVPPPYEPVGPMPSAAYPQDPSIPVGQVAATSWAAHATTTPLAPAPQVIVVHVPAASAPPPPPPVAAPPPPPAAAPPPPPAAAPPPPPAAAPPPPGAPAPSRQPSGPVTMPTQQLPDDVAERVGSDWVIVLPIDIAGLLAHRPNR